MLDRLMWKDIQNQKGVLILGLLFLLGPYLLYFFSGINSQWPEEGLASMAMMSMIVSQLTVVVMGATIIGVERQNRGMDFLLALPASRSKVLLSKAIVSLIVAAVIWGVFLVVMEAIVAEQLSRHFRHMGTTCAVVGMTLFGIAWLGSILIRGVAIPVAISLVVTAAIATVLYKLWAVNEWSIHEHATTFRAILYSIYLTTGVSCFVAGWIVFTRRFEP